MMLVVKKYRKESFVLYRYNYDIKCFQKCQIFYFLLKFKISNRQDLDLMLGFESVIIEKFCINMSIFW